MYTTLSMFTLAAAAAFAFNLDPLLDPLVDKPLAGFQRDLLNLAFETATAIPIQPYIKTRSRIQETVVAASLELHQPRLAHAHIQRIDNWRRGASYADLAFGMT